MSKIRTSRGQRVAIEWSPPARHWPLRLGRCHAAARGREGKQEEERTPGEVAVAVPLAIAAPPLLPSAVPRAAARCASREGVSKRRRSGLHAPGRHAAGGATPSRAAGVAAPRARPMGGVESAGGARVSCPRAASEGPRPALHPVDPLEKERERE